MPKKTPTTKFITWRAEITDTYGGEANYAWVKRYEQTFPITASERAIVQHFKMLMDYTGVQCKRAAFGDVIELRPYGECVVIFIQPEY